VYGVSLKSAPKPLPVKIDPCRQTGPSVDSRRFTSNQSQSSWVRPNVGTKIDTDLACKDVYFRVLIHYVHAKIGP
jgi:hypothetical protein